MRQTIALLGTAAVALALGGAAAAGSPDMILRNGKIVLLAPDAAPQEALAIEDGRILAVGRDADIRGLAGKDTVVVDLGGRTVIPGLIDSHIHAIRAGAEHMDTVDLGEARNMAELLRQMSDRARTAPKGGWLIVRGGWHRNQIAERRIPTPAELDKAAPDNPALILHSYQEIILNRRAVEALKLTAADSLPAPLQVELDAAGRPTGIIMIRGGSVQVSELLARISRPTPQEKVEGTRRFFAALNRGGLTGIIDDGGVEGSAQYRSVFELWRKDELSLRVRFNVQSVTRGKELEEVQDALQLTPPGFGDDKLRVLGLGEYMTAGMFDSSSAKAADKTPEARAGGLAYARWAAENGYPIDVHVTHDATASVLLDIFEEVNRTTPVAPLRWKFSHGEDFSDETLRRMARLGMGFSAQDRLYFDAKPYIAARGVEATKRAPPIMSATRLGVPVGAGTDATVPTPWSPFISLQWFVTGRSADGTETRSPNERATRLEALQMYTLNNAWMSFEEKTRGSLEAGKYADLLVLDRDYLTVPENEIGRLRPLVTMVGGKVVYAAGPFANLASAGATP